MSPADCPFCRIIQGEIQTTLLFQDDLVTAFKDAHPITPVHLLIVPNRHIISVNHASIEDEAALGHMVMVAQLLAQQHHVEATGYRLVINTGRDAGQSVFHLHMHLIAGRHMPFRFDP